MNTVILNTTILLSYTIKANAYQRVCPLSLSVLPRVHKPRNPLRQQKTKAIRAAAAAAAAAAGRTRTTARGAWTSLVQSETFVCLYTKCVLQVLLHRLHLLKNKKLHFHALAYFYACCGLSRCIHKLLSVIFLRCRQHHCIVLLWVVTYFYHNMLLSFLQQSPRRLSKRGRLLYPARGAMSDFTVESTTILICLNIYQC
jgi:hypothetical protein